MGHVFLFALLLLALLSVSLLMASQLDSTQAQRDREQALLHIGNEFREALRRYHTARAGTPVAQHPLTLEELLKDSRYPHTVRHLRRIYIDPMTNKPEWGLVRQAGRIVGVHSTSILVPIKQSGFETHEESFKNAKSYRDWVFMLPAASVQPPVPASAPPATFAPQTFPLPRIQR